MKWIICAITLSLIFGCTAKEARENTRSHSAAPAEDNTNKRMTVQKNTTKVTETRGKTIRLENSKHLFQQKKIILDVPLISQNPELKYGCEVTSLAMVLKHAGVKVDKLELADAVKKDNDKLSTNITGDITHWGDPADGFVGDMTGKGKGYAVYVEPLQELMERYLPGRSVNLTAKKFDELLNQVKKGKPVVVWTTGDFKMPDRWESWNHGQEKIKTPLDLHAVVLVGFDPDYVYVNDPLAVKKAYRVPKQSFIDSWIALKRQALSYE